MTTTTHSPARILQAYLLAQGVVTDFDSGVAWACSVGDMPDDWAVHDSAVAIFDSAGLQDGRLVSNGDPVEFPGVQVRIRSADHDAAWAKAKEIADLLNPLTSGAASVGGSSYTLRSVSQQSPVLFLGRAPSTNRRLLSQSAPILSGKERATRRHLNLTINYLVTVDEA